MQKLTLKKIAKELDVSISTVSKSLKDSTEIGEETKQKIQAFAKLYNYRPNNIALSLKNQKTKTLGIIVPEIVHHYFTTVIKGVERVANNKGYTVIVGLSNESFQKEVTNMDKLANGSIDGFIISVSKETQKRQDFHHLKEIIEQGMPIVMFDRIIPEIECDKVIINDSMGATKAVELLLSQGCSSIGIVTTQDHVSVGKLRTDGYKNALMAHGMEVHDEWILQLPDNIETDDPQGELYLPIYHFLKAHPELDAVFAVNEMYALTALKAIKDLGREVPADVKIIGFTDGVLSKFATPSLSTVHQHGEQIGERAATLLINRIENDLLEGPFITETINTELIERASTSVIKNPK